MTADDNEELDAREKFGLRRSLDEFLAAVPRGYQVNFDDWHFIPLDRYCAAAAAEITALRARVATEAAMRVQCANDSQAHLDRALAAESQLQQVKVDAERMTAHESWLAHRIEWLKSEAHKGGDWEYLRIKWEETAYVLEKFRATRRNDGTA